MTEEFRLCDDYLTRWAALDPVAAGMAEPQRVHAEVVREFGWPGPAISYTLGERGWLAAREQAMRRPGPGGFDLKQWHTAALGLGPVGLDGLTEALATAGTGSA